MPAATPQLAARPAGLNILLAGLLVAAGVAVYLNSFSGVFLFDDHIRIVKDMRIRQLPSAGELLALHRRPILTLSLAINFALGGLNVWGYHAFNLTIHILSALTLFGIIRRTLEKSAVGSSYGRAAAWLACTAALIWVVHPLQTQSVTYVIQRAESMMGLCYLLTLYCVIRGADAVRPSLWYALALFACALGLGSKKVIVTAPLLVLLYDRVYLSDSIGGLIRKRWWLHLGLFSMWVYLLVTGVVERIFSPPAAVRAAVGFGVRGVSPIDYALTQPGVILHYLKLSFWPSSLCLDYGWPVARTPGEIVLPALLIAGLLAVTLWALWRKSRVGFVGAWFFLILAPTSSFIPIKDVSFEHRMYLPLAAVVVLTVLGFFRLIVYCSAKASISHVASQTISAGLVVMVVTALGARTAQRNKHYHSELVMWKDVLAQRPDNSRAHYNLGTLLTEQGLAEDAIREFRAALRLKSNDARMYNNLGYALAKASLVDEAIAAHREAVRVNPRHAGAHYNLANLLQKRGKTDQAIQAYREAARLNPRLAEAYVNLGHALGSQGDYEGAIRAYRAVLEIDRRFVSRETLAKAHFNLGYTLSFQGRLDAAIHEYRETLRINPDHAQARRRLDALSAKQQKPEPQEAGRANPSG